MKADQRILKDIEDAMKSIKQHVKRSALKSGSMDSAMKEIDRSTEMMYIVECERLNRIYHMSDARCESCGGKKKCVECAGRGKKTGLLMEGKCRSCKGTGVCRSCIERSERMLDVLKSACVYARLRGELSFEATLRKMGIDIHKASIYQGITKIAEGR